ncbi:hypothetical protein C8Q75DRAFT_751903 [Abortiporus biennis]|nr:hypothetical protein C8Q75DRAFT_751903 [Abortiporus biennis]
MAYNREWDRGKESSWNEHAAWNDRGHGYNNYNQGHVRGRDDDYYNEGKRRKYNNGGYDTSQGYEDNYYDNGYTYNQAHPGGSGGGGDWNQDYDDRHQPRIQGGSGGYNPKKRLVPSEPSPHVIFLGLDPDFTEADLQAYLTGHGCNIETVTIIRDRSTGASKGFGFAQFTNVETARAFVDPLFPFIQVPPPASHGASATTAFYQSLEAGLPHTGRRVKIDYSQSANPGEKRRGPLNTNDGTRDIGNTQAPVLLFRGLDPLSGPQAIAQALKTSSGPGKEGAKGMKRIILIKDKITLQSWGFAFVEFVDVTSAATVLGATMSPQIHPNGFRISDRPVAASFAHPYSFQPLPDYSLRDDACLTSSMSLGGMEGTWVRYWDEASTIALLEFEVAEPVQPTTVSTEKKKEKKKHKDGLTTNKGPTEASALPVSDKPVTLNFKGGFGQKIGIASGTSITAPIKKPAPLALGFSLNEEDGEGGNGEGVNDDDVDEKNDSEDAKAPTFKKVAPMVTSKKTVNNINKWNQVQEELRDGTDNIATPPVVVATPIIAPVAVTPPAPPPKVATPEAKAKSATPVAVEAEFEFSDTNAKTCLLCARQFKSLDQLRRHNNESDLHKKNHKDANLRDVAREKAKTAKAKAEESQLPQPPKYRDRASERRIMHHQPDIPLPESSTGGGSGGNGKAQGKKRHAEGPPPPPSPPPPPINPGEDQNNVGNKLLKMMGWKEGTGLGVEGEGRVEPIQTAIYAAGAGLGASKGKEIGKYVEGYSGYVHMAQDAARERYGS